MTDDVLDEETGGNHCPECGQEKGQGKCLYCQGYSEVTQ